MTEPLQLERRIEIRLMENHPREAASTVESLPADEAAAVLAAAPVEPAARVLECMVASVGAATIERLGAERARDILVAIEPNVSVHMLRRLPEDRRQAMIDALPPVRRLSLMTLLSHAENTAGALMDPDELVLPDDISVREARSRIKEAPNHVHYNLYVVDREHRLVGVLNQSELMAADANQRLADVMVKATMSIRSGADLPRVLENPGWRQVSALPVIDKEKRFIGVIRYRKLRSLESARDDVHAQAPVSTARSLGELYAAGLGGLVEALAAIATGKASHDKRGPS